MESETRIISIQAHFDGKVIVPHGEVDLIPGQDIVLSIETAPNKTTHEGSALAWLAANAVDSPELPSGLAHQHDHYLCGIPKRIRLEPAYLADTIALEW